MKYTTLFTRLVANTAEPDNERSCWCWTARRDKGCYGRVSLYVAGLQKSTSLQAHVVMWILTHTDVRTTDDIWLAAQELRGADLQIDHLCHNPPCCSPDHLEPEPLTPAENSRRRGMFLQRASQLLGEYA